MMEAAEQRAWAIRPEPPRDSASFASDDAGGVFAGPAVPGSSQVASSRLLVGRLLQAAWRRRYLIIVPILLMAPVSVAIALLVPGNYTARTLLLLQEGEKGNPLAREASAPGSIQQRVAGLEALLKSDQVLMPLLEMSGTPSNPKRVSQALQELRKDLTLELIGSDFIAVELRGPKGEGLGGKLSRILARFFEVLLAENAPNAANVVIQRRRDELQAAENERARLEAEVAKALPGGLEAAKARLQGLESKLQAQRGAPDASAPDQSRDTEQAIAELKGKLDDSVDLQKRLEFSERELARQRANYEIYLNRFGDLAGGQGASVLNAPGRIKVIDPPSDPPTGNGSRLKFLAAGLLGSVLIGIGLAWAAETLDPVIRYPDQLVKATGIPVLARLPRIDTSPPSSAAGRAEALSWRWASGRRWRIAGALVAAAAIAGFAVGFAPNLSLMDSYAAVHGWITRAF